MENDAWGENIFQSDIAPGAIHVNCKLKTNPQQNVVGLFNVFNTASICVETLLNQSKDQLKLFSKPIQQRPYHVKNLHKLAHYQLKNVSSNLHISSRNQVEHVQ